MHKRGGTLRAAFADLGTFIFFVVAYVSVLKMDPVGILFEFGTALVGFGFLYRTPIPVQPMKPIGAAAASQAGMISAGAVVAASLLTGAIRLLLRARRKRTLSRLDNCLRPR